MESVLTKSQKKQFTKEYTEDGRRYRITANVRHDDECGNGHNTFSITGSIDEWNGKRWREHSGGCIHEEVAKHFPHLAPFIKWHLCGTDGPLHYIANTTYHVSNGDIEAAASTAIWPDATDEDLTSPGLKERLKARLPQLMADFRRAVESLGFVW